MVMKTAVKFLLLTALLACAIESIHAEDLETAVESSATRTLLDNDNCRVGKTLIRHNTWKKIKGYYYQCCDGDLYKAKKKTNRMCRYDDDDDDNDDKRR